MKSCRFSRIVAVFATAVLASSFATAQLSAEKVAATNRILQQVKATHRQTSAFAPADARRLREHQSLGRRVGEVRHAPDGSIVHRAGQLA